MSAHLSQFIGREALRVVAVADRMEVVMAAVENLVRHGVTGRVRLVDIHRPAFFQFDGVGEGGKLSNPSLMIATNPEGAALVQKWVREFAEGDTPVTQIIGNFFPKPDEKT